MRQQNTSWPGRMRQKVRGIGHLQIADASVMPSVPSGHTNAPVLAIAERAASLLTGEQAISS